MSRFRVVALIGLLAGCTGSPVRQHGIETGGRVGSGAEGDRESANDGAVRNVGHEEVSGASTVGLSLEMAITTAVGNNPRLRAVRLEAGVAEAQIYAASIYPFNPQFNSTVRDARFSNGGGHAEGQLYSLLQELELAGQRDHRRAEADASHQRVLWEIEAAEIGVAIQVRRVFFTAVYRRQKWELAESIAKVNQELSEVLDRRYKAQLATLADVSISKVEARDAARRARAARADYDAAMVELRRALGGTGKVAVVPTDELPSAAVYSEIENVPDRMVEQALAERTDLKARKSEVETASARLRLARAGRIPNVTVGVEYERDESATKFIGGTVSVPIPIINNNRGVVSQREAELVRASGQVTQLQTEIRQETEAALQRYERAREQGLANERDARDGLEVEQKRIEDLYREGDADLLRVYEVRQRLNQVQDA